MPQAAPFSIKKVNIAVPLPGMVGFCDEVAILALKVTLIAEDEVLVIITCICLGFPVMFVSV